MLALSNAMHPEIDYSLADLGMVKDVSVEEDKVGITIGLPFAEVPIKDLLARLVRDAVAGVHETASVEIDFAVMSDEEREEFGKKAREKWKQ
jgi:metal-sulfur cluster biosynthetic enzyme